VLTPALCATMLKPIDHHKERRGPGAWFNRNFDRATGGYVSSIGYLLKRPLRVMLMFAIVIGGMSWLFLRLPSSFLPEEDQGVLMTIVQLPNGATVTRTEEIIKKIEDYYLDKETDAIQDVFSVSGFSFTGSGQNYALVFAKLKDFELREEPQLAASAVVQRAMGYFFTLRDAMVFPLQPPAIPGLGTSSGFSMYLVDSGKNGTEALTAAAQQLMQAGSSNPSVSSLRSNNPPAETQLKFLLDQEKMGAMGLDIATVNNMLSTIFAGRDVNDFTLNGELKPVYVQGDAPYRMQESAINDWHARNANGEMVPFSSFVKTQWISGAPTLSRFNGVGAISMEGAAAAGVSSGTAMDAMEQLTADMNGGYTVAWQGISYQERLSGSQAPLLYALSVLIVFLCLAALYESWSIPFSVIMAVPVGVLGAVAAATLFGQSNDVYFKVGLLTTIGLAAKNAILIVEFAKDRQAAGLSVIDATLEAAKLRLRPIIMTSLAFILGVVPLAIATGAGSAAQNSIGIGVLGGMLTATALGIFFVPSFFVIIRQLFGGAKQKEELS
jgi:multidrug efflux pump